MSVKSSTNEVQTSYDHCEQLYSTWQRHVRANHRVRGFFTGWRSLWAKMAHENRFGPLDD